jgi:hypothetical protein
VRAHDRRNGTKVQGRTHRVVTGQCTADGANASPGAHPRSHRTNTWVIEVPDKPCEPSWLRCDVRIDEDDQRRRLFDFESRGTGVASNGRPTVRRSPMQHPAQPRGHFGDPMGGVVTVGRTVVDHDDLPGEVPTQRMDEAGSASGVVPHRYDDGDLSWEDRPRPRRGVQQPAGDQAACQPTSGARRHIERFFAS